MADEKTKLYLNVTKIALVILGALGLGGYSYTNHSEAKRAHAQSERGYETLATQLNQNILTRLDRMEMRLDALELVQVSHQPALSSHVTAPASQPKALPSPSKDPYGDLRKDVNRYVMKAAARPAPAAKPPSRVPAKLKDVW